MAKWEQSYDLDDKLEDAHRKECAYHIVDLQL